SGRSCPTHFLLVNQALCQSRSTSAILLGPTDANPARGMHLSMPLAATLPLLLAIFHEGIISMRAFLWSIGLKPRSQFQPKGFIFGAIVKIHDSDSFAYSLLCLSSLELRGAFGGKSGDSLTGIVGTRHDCDTAQLLFDLTLQGLIPTRMHESLASAERFRRAGGKLDRQRMGLGRQFTVRDYPVGNPPLQRFPRGQRPVGVEQF